MAGRLAQLIEALLLRNFKCQHTGQQKQDQHCQNAKHPMRMVQRERHTLRGISHGQDSKWKDSF
jgi:hypothetical protein